MNLLSGYMHSALVRLSTAIVSAAVAVPACLPFLPLPVFAGHGPESLDFDQISIEQGLSQSIVLDIVQDSRGFLWFATEDGLNKYDGYDFTVLRHDPHDSSSISYNYILALCVDSREMLWVGTFQRGLDMYDPATGDCVHFRHDPEDPGSLSNDMVRVIHEDPGGVIWVGTDGGLNRLDRERGVFTRFTHDPSDPAGIGHDEIRALCDAGGGGLWIGTNGGGLYRYDSGNDSFAGYRHDPEDPRSLPANSVRSLTVDREGVLWVGTEGGGLCRFDEDGESFECFANDPSDPHSLSHNSVFAIFETSGGELWIGTNGGGLCRFDRDSGGFIRYVNDPNDPASLSYNEIYSIYEDGSGVVWLGTYGGGVNKVNLRKSRFRHFRHDSNDPNSLSHPIVWCMVEDGPDILWIGTHGGGLNRLDRKTGRFTHFLHDEDDPSSISSNIVRQILIDRSGTLWTGTHGGGLCRYDRKSGRFRTYRHDPSDPRSISHDEIRCIYEDSRGVLWAGTNGGGLNRMDDRDAGSFTRFENRPGDSSSLSNDFARTVFEDSEGGFWVGTQGGGLNLMDRERGEFVSFRHDPHDSTSIISDFVFSIYEDDEGILWIGTWGGGLVRFDRHSGEFTAYTRRHGLPSNSIYGLLEDDRGNFWMSSNNGICRFDPETGRVKVYTELDGLQSNEFNGGSFYRSDSGEMFFGGIDGLNSFFPDDIVDNPFVPPVVITSFRKLNREVDLGKATSRDGVLRLNHNDYVISFEFAALEYSAPEKNRYAYMMEGLDDEWIFTDHTKRFANFTTLPPGRYTFRVRGSNNDGVWNEEGASVRILITPPYWHTWWFRLIVTAGLVMAGLLLYRRRLTNMRMKIELRTAHDAQMSIMPQEDPSISGFGISGVCIPASEVGGDFYDYFWLDDDRRRFGITIGDVSGKAMKAAVIAIMSSGMIYSRPEDESSPAAIMTRVNSALHRKTEANMYTALCLASLDVETGEMRYAMAGFNAPLLKSNGMITKLEEAGYGLPLGALDDSTYREALVRLRPGDVVVLYTDGVTEALDSSGRFYEEERLVRLLQRMEAAGLSASEIKNRIVVDVLEFTGNTGQADDMTMIVIKAEEGCCTAPD